MTRYGAFERLGIEIEYAIVGREDLRCMPIADVVLDDLDTPAGALGWSNEFMLHVLELKNPTPIERLDALRQPMQAEIDAMNRRLAQHGARLMPTAMHPWLDPRDARPWPVDPHGIYGAYQRIFETRTHGWANLQSIHINLPFADDGEFARLHEAIRRVLPIIPAIAASSPVADARLTGFRNFRMQAYRTNAARYPLVAGNIIPDSIGGAGAYEAEILAPMFASLAQADPEGTLRFPWLNSRGAIPRFDRHSIEIRVTDTQECIEADLAVAKAIIAAVRLLYLDEAPLAAPLGTSRLVSILGRCIERAEDALIDDADYLSALGRPGNACTAGELWRHLLGRSADGSCIPHLERISRAGTLASRIERALGAFPSRERIASVYAELCECLAKGAAFRD